VSSFTVLEVLDALELRGVLEGTAVRLAAERLTSPEELADLKVLLVAAKLDYPVTTEGFSRFLELNERFHQEFWRLAKSPPLVRALEAACRIPFVAPGASVFIDADREPNDIVVAAEHHRAIVEAIEAREGTRGEALAREHTRVVRRTVEWALRRRDATKRVLGAGLVVPEGKVATFRRR
jgi:GntR family transcriptional regulator of vanillate catabolism